MRKGLHILWLVILCQLSVVAQNSKGLSVSEPTADKPLGKTHALIVGISKYQNPAIPPLQFADRDAVAFRNYLVATGVDSNNITLLLNEKATNGEFWASLNFMTDIVKQGDRIFIYFSGHGDVENKTIVKDAYLLPYDAPKCVYPSGAIAVTALKSWIATFSAKGVKPIFIADACRSGNLAGGREGMDAAAEALKDKWQDEIKILSCQPGELSLEGKQWGDGRGLFSYELLNGMSGMADKNHDGKVTVRELNLFLMDRVPDEANPMHQNPMLFGDAETVISYTNQKLLSEISLHKSANTFAAIDFKGYDEILLAKQDDSVKANYRMFKKSMDDQNYYFSDYDGGKHKDQSAYHFLKQIPVTDTTKVLISLMQNNLMAAIVTSLQFEIDLFQYDGVNFTGYLAELDMISMRQALSILRNEFDTKRLTSIGFTPKLLYYESLYSLLVEKNRNQSLLKIDSAIAMDGNVAIFYNLRGQLMQDRYSAIHEYLHAIKLSPKYPTPYFAIADTLLSDGKIDSAFGIYRYVVSFDSMFEYRQQCFVAIALAKIGKTESSDSLIDEIIKLQPHQKLYMSDHPKVSYADIAFSFFEYGLYKKAIDLYKLCLTEEYNYMNGFPLYKIASAYAELNDVDNAIAYLKKYFDLSQVSSVMFIGDPRLDPIRSTPEFKSLMKKYFPDQYKE